MNIFNIESEAQKITASIKVVIDDYESCGTGIIVIPNSEKGQFGYLFTAQHVLTGSQSFQYGDYDSQPIQLIEKNLEIKLNDLNIRILNNTFYKPHKKEDFAFGIIDLKDNNLTFLPKIKISNYDLIYRQELKYLIFGHPNITNGIGESLELKSPSEITPSEYIDIPRIKLKSEIPIGVAKQGQSGSDIADKLQGFSGSGVFFTDHTEIHLTGLVVEALGFASIIILDFNRIVEIANLIIEDQLTQDKNILYPILETNTNFNCASTLLNLRDINNENILNYIENKIGGVKQEDIEKLKNNSKAIETEKIKIDAMLKELAKNCAYIGAEYNQQKRYNLATRYFNHAISIDNSYNTIFLTAKNNRKKGENIDEILKNSEEIINNSYNDPISKANALKEKILALEEKENSLEAYTAICDLLTTISPITPSISIDEVHFYIDKCKTILNDENVKQVSKGKLPTIDPYIYMAELCKEFNLLDDSIFFLTCAKEIAKLLRKKEESEKTLSFINNQIDTFIHQNTLNPSAIFNAQKNAEKAIGYIENIKNEHENNIINDIGIIIDKINEIYNKSNDTGILKKIDENIRLLIEKSPVNIENQTPSLEQVGILSSLPTSENTNHSSNRTKFLNSILMYLIFSISISATLSGSSLQMPLH